MNKIIRSFWPYAVTIVLFIIVSLFYFSPVLQGKKIQQSDITQFIGSSKEIADFRKTYNQEPYWTNATFGGMPTYAVSAYYSYNYIKKVDQLIRILPHPANYLFLYFLGFFILLTILKVEWKLAVFGALGFGLSTYLIIILGVGHNAKAHAIAYMPLVLSGIILMFDKKYLLGFVLTFLAMALEINASHVQMTYYLMFLVLIYGVFQILESYQNKEMPHFAKSIGLLIAAVVLALGVNATSLLATQEYAQSSTRSKSELTVNPDGSPKEISTGLSKDYITEYSYGKAETFNLFIPRFMGGTRYESIENSEVQNFLQQSVNNGLNPSDANYVLQLTSMYWGNQPIVAAPAYIGAVLIFLFVLGIFLVNNKYKKWLITATVFSILLSWGRNFSGLTNFFIDYVPLYNKFRAVSSIQVIAELAVPLLGILALQNFFSEKIESASKLKALKLTTYIVGGFALLFVVLGTGLFSFETPFDTKINEQLPGYLDAVVADRKSLFFNDSLRTLLFVLSVILMLFLYLKQKVNKSVTIVILGFMMVLDLLVVDKRYVNDEAFVAARKVEKPFTASKVDKEILNDKSYFRVLNLSKDPMTDGATSYFHKSIGGYHAAKPRRYQELYDYHIAKGNMEVLNMLNTKYFIGTSENEEKGYEINVNANGNVWFVRTLKMVSTANDEIFALDSVNTKLEAVVNTNHFNDELEPTYKTDSAATIKLTSYKANELKYESNSVENQFAVFSEMYYKNGWNAYIDGVLQPHYRVNYVLRGMLIPKGKHNIVFKFEPEVIAKGGKITLVSYSLFIIVVGGWFFYSKKQKLNRVT